MPRIKILPENLVNMIAAGEIIDRPASVVKELVENSIDAGSDQIEVHLLGYGKEEIKVIDNGCGMGRHDALLAFERHATSKISQPEDLEKIHTLGFRGEALPSIAAVAQLVIITRERESEIGTQVVVEGGKLIRVCEIGAPVGTMVRVSSLFKNVPARLKFLKSNSVEFSHITQVLEQESLSHHQISFTFKHNGKIVWQMPKVLTLAERIGQLFGYEILDHLLEIDGEAGSCRIQGFIGQASFSSRSSRSCQYTYVNGRFVRSPIILKAISEGCDHILPRERHAVCFLFLTLPPKQVDVNVHPAKIEVRFSNQQEVFEGIVRLIKDQLSSSRSAVPSIGIINTRAGETFAQKGIGPKLQESPLGESGTRGKEDGATRANTLPLFPDRAASEAACPDGQASRSFAALDLFGPGLTACEPACLAQPDYECSKLPHPESSDELADDSVRDLFIAEGDFLQIKNSFILFETRQGLLIVDQHAAHERIRYEQLWQEYRMKTFRAQQLLVPITFQLPAYLAASAEEVLSQLRLVGFDLEPFGHGTFVIKAVPLSLTNTDPRELIREMFADLTQMMFRKHDPQGLFDALLMRAACSSAIKANHRLSKEEMRSLIEQLRLTSMPLRCPHGRPTIIQLELKLLEKYFMRI
ncbi:MAG: DNA mismatch repair endonuclease MutL [bacterium]|nr:DNA mismatch repair endonuclease MutL [bacterium]